MTQDPVKDGMDPMNEKPRIAIVGAGPVGGIMGAHLASAGHDVSLVDILADHLGEIGRSGLIVEGIRELNSNFPIDRLIHSVDDMAGREFDVVIVSVKAVIMPFIIPSLKDVLSPGTTMVSLQNGLDTEDVLAESFGQENVLRIVVNYGGNLASNGRVRMNFFNPPNHIGGLDSGSEAKARTLADLITGSGLETEFTDEIKKHEWEKLILNLALAALCSLTTKTMKEMMEFEPTRQLARELMVEGIDVASAHGFDFGRDFIDQCMDWVDRTGYHMPSMAVDLMNGKRTEIAFLNGKVVEYGKLAGVATPANSAITSLVRGRELPPRGDD